MAKGRNKVLIGSCIAVVLIIISIVGIVHVSEVRKENRRAQNIIVDENSNDRTLIIVNDTGEILNLIKVYLSDCSEIEKVRIKNPDDEITTIKIPRKFRHETNFTVALTDRFGLKYEKTVSSASLGQKVTLKFTKDDYKKQSKDFVKKFNKFFN